MGTLQHIQAAERLIAQLSDRGVTLALKANGHTIEVSSAGALQDKDRQAIKALKPAVVAVLGSPAHSCPRCDIVRAGCAALELHPKPIVVWFHPDRWKPVSAYGSRRCGPMLERDTTDRDPSMLPIVKAVVSAGAQALAVPPDEVFDLFFKDLTEAASVETQGGRSLTNKRN
jgi:hypothetical protein